MSLNRVYFETSSFQKCHILNLKLLTPGFWLLTPFSQNSSFLSGRGLKLLIDEDSQALPLVKTLRKANHDVITVNEANLMGQPDNVVLEYATQNNRIVLTRNCRDFKALHEAKLNHQGIFAVYQEANPLKKMNRKDIVKAIANIEAAQIPLQNQFIALNHWNY